MWCQNLDFQLESKWCPILTWKFCAIVFLRKITEQRKLFVARRSHFTSPQFALTDSLFHLHAAREDCTFRHLTIQQLFNSFKCMRMTFCRVSHRAFCYACKLWAKSKKLRDGDDHDWIFMRIGFQIMMSASLKFFSNSHNRFLRGRNEVWHVKRQVLLRSSSVVEHWTLIGWSKKGR